jgi:hypothetical protein
VAGKKRPAKGKRRRKGTAAGTIAKPYRDTLDPHTGCPPILPEVRIAAAKRTQ